MTATTVKLDSLKGFLALAFVTGLATALTFVSISAAGVRLHFFQLGILLAAFVFGPVVGAFVGAVSSSVNAVLVLHNPWVIGGNLLLGYFAGRFFPKVGALRSAFAAFGIQVSYLAVTDIFVIGMPIAAVMQIGIILLVTDLISAFFAGKLAPTLSARLS